MPSHMNMTALGFPVTTEQDFRHYVYHASEFGRKIETPNGSYTLWEVGNGIELWVQTNLHKRILGMKAHFHGQSRMRVGLIKHVSWQEQTILDGAFYAWANPPTGDPEAGAFPFVFDLPDYDTYHAVLLPCITDVQLAAFARHLTGFSDEATYMASRDADMKLAPGSLIPSGLFTPDGKAKEPPLAEVIFNGRVLETARLANPVTSQKFYWARVRIPGGEMDVVADPQIVQGTLVQNGIVNGAFCLSGRLL
ncbi:MAG: hypothetical protein NVS2B12_27660 [Ktedonobacteraceae bacterium]